MILIFYFYNTSQSKLRLIRENPIFILGETISITPTPRGEKIKYQYCYKNNCFLEETVLSTYDTYFTNKENRTKVLIVISKYKPNLSFLITNKTEIQDYNAEDSIIKIFENL